MPPARSATAAPRRQARKQPQRTTRRAPARPIHLRVRWDKVGRVLLLVVFTVVVGLYIQRGLTYLSVRSAADQQAAIVHRLSHENASLTRQAKALNDPATIQRDARALGMVMPRERPYAVTGMPSR